MTRRHKFGARRTLYDGRWYASRLEADFARLLDILRAAENQAERVVMWIPQVRFTFLFPENSRLKRSHVVDFMVWKADGSWCLVEVKGRETPLGRFKRELLEHCLGFRISVWTKDGWR